MANHIRPRKKIDKTGELIPWQEAKNKIDQKLERNENRPAIKAKLRKRPEKENPVHIIADRKINGQYLILRTTQPNIQVLYNPMTKQGTLYNNVSGFVEWDERDEKFIQTALKKAIAWAKHNIKN